MLKEYLPYPKSLFLSSYNIKMNLSTILSLNASRMPSSRHFLLLNTKHASAKDKAPVLDTFNCIYEFTCISGSKYIGRMERCLSTRIKEHLPKWLMLSEEKIPKSSITKHLLDIEHSVDLKVCSRVINKQTRSKSLKYAGARAIRLH